MGEHRQVSRRQFMTAASAAAVSAWSAPAWTAQSARRVLGANHTLAIGIIGLGRRGMELVDDLQHRPDVRITAASDIFAPRKEQGQALTGARLFHDWRDLLCSDIDAVVIATPDHWHARMTLAAFGAGLDVYCERPMALNSADAAAVRDKAGATGRMLQVGVQETSEAQWHAARDYVQSHRLGKVQWAQGRYGQHRRADTFHRGASVTPQTLDWKAFCGPTEEQPFEAARFFGWRRYWDYSGGIATDVLYAQLAPLLLALGPELPAAVSAVGGAHDAKHEVPDAFVMTAQYPAGHTIMLASTAHTSRRDLPAVVRGSETTLYAEGTRLRLVDEESDNTVLIPTADRPDHLGNWLDAVRTRQKPVCNEHLAYATTVATCMAMEAYRSTV